MAAKKKPKQHPRTGAADLTAVIEQAAIDKLLSSANYPLELFYHHEDFHGYELVKAGPVTVPSAAHEYSPKEIAQLLADTQSWGGSRDKLEPPTKVGDQFYSALLKQCAETIESAKACLRARDEASAAGKQFKGPSAADMQAILDGGIKGLASVRGIEFRALLTDLRVIARKKPTVVLQGPTVNLPSISIAGDAAAEVWWYHPTFHCSWLCFNWSVTWSWDRLVRVGVSGVDFDAAGHAEATTDGPLVAVRATADKLRLDYDVIRALPLEGIANHYLGDKPVFVYDASKLVAAVPVLASKFTVASIDLPAITGGLQVDVTIKQI